MSSASRISASGISLAPASTIVMPSRAIDRAGGELYVWTVDDLKRIRSLQALGVTGVISNDPRLFTAPV